MGSCMSKSAGKDVRSNYDLREEIGRGSFAIVKRAIKKADQTEYAIKIIKKNKLLPDELLALQEEVDILKHIQHANCVQMFEYYDTPKVMYIVMEWLSGKELFDRIVLKGNYTEKEAAVAIKCIASGIHYLHTQGIVHRDIKPENLIYKDSSNDSQLKITDFGLAKSGGDEKAFHTACGTPGYVAPEVLKNQDYGKEVDCWSMGVILYIILCGYPPFYHESTAGLYKQIKKGQFDFPAAHWKDITQSAKDLIKKLLTVNPTERYTAQQVLEHGWICNDEASPRSFGDAYTASLRLVAARNRFRVQIRVIIAINRVARELKKIISTRLTPG